MILVTSYLQVTFTSHNTIAFIRILQNDFTVLLKISYLIFSAQISSLGHQRWPWGRSPLRSFPGKTRRSGKLGRLIRSIFNLFLFLFLNVGPNRSAFLLQFFTEHINPQINSHPPWVFNPRSLGTVGYEADALTIRPRCPT